MVTIINSLLLWVQKAHFRFIYPVLSLESVGDGWLNSYV